MASKLKVSLSKNPDIFNQLEKAMQPVFKTNHVLIYNKCSDIIINNMNKN